MNSTTNDKLREQAFSNNAVGRSCKYVYSWQNLDNTERLARISGALVLFESSLAKVRSWPIAGRPNQSCHHSRSWGLHSFINTQSMLSEQQQSSLVFLLAYCVACYV